MTTEPGPDEETLMLVEETLSIEHAQHLMDLFVRFEIPAQMTMREARGGRSYLIAVPEDYVEHATLIQREGIVHEAEGDASDDEIEAMLRDHREGTAVVPDVAPAARLNHNERLRKLGATIFILGLALALWRCASV